MDSDKLLNLATSLGCLLAESGAEISRVEESETNTFPPVSGKLKVGVDLGTAYIVLVVLDEENNPVACEKRAANVLRDGVVVDYTGALRIVRELKEKLEARLILQVHDELLVEAPEAEAARVAALLKEEMEAAAALQVKLEAEVHIGSTWYDAKG